MQKRIVLLQNILFLCKEIAKCVEKSKIVCYNDVGTQSHIFPPWGNTFLVKGVFSFSAYHGGDCVPTMREYTFSVRSLLWGDALFCSQNRRCKFREDYSFCYKKTKKEAVCNEEGVNNSGHCHRCYYGIYPFARSYNLDSLNQGGKKNEGKIY